MYPSPARLFYLLYPFLMLLRGSEATTSASSSLECGLSGLCQDGQLKQSSSRSLENCILFGRSIPGATWVSFNREHDCCWALQACDNLDADLPDPMSSSEVNRTLCSATGACKDVLLIDYFANSSEDCLNLCGAEEGCAWYSFDAESQYCALFKSCSDLLVDGHENWLSGEVACSNQQEIVWIDADNGAARLGKILYFPKPEMIVYYYLFTTITYKSYTNYYSIIYSYFSEPEYKKSVQPAQLPRSGWTRTCSAHPSCRPANTGCLWIMG